MLTLYHGSTQIVDKPEIRTHKYHKDFYWGFYCTQIEAQAVRWATRRGRSGVVNVYSFAEDASLRILRFEEMDEAWLDFIAACRTGHPHDYDVVEGPMADDAYSTMCRAFWTARFLVQPFGNWSNSSTQPTRSASIRKRPCNT